MADHAAVIREALIHGPPYAESDDTTALAALDALLAERDALRERLAAAASEREDARAERDAAVTERDEWRKQLTFLQSDPAFLAATRFRNEVADLRNEVNCRIEHGADSGGHLEYVQARIDAALDAAESETPAAEATLTRYRNEAVELAECVMHGWTNPAFARGRLHERAVEIARAVIARAALDGPKEEQ